MLAILAITLHRKRDALAARPATPPEREPPTQVDKLVTSRWWESSTLRGNYEQRGLAHFHWSNAESVPEREQENYETVYLDDAGANVRYRIVNRSGQVLMAKRDA